MTAATRYTLFRGLLAAALLAAWTYLVLSLRVTGFLANTLLAYATLQLFESIGRETGAPSLPEYGSFGREGIAMLCALMLAFIIATSDTEVELSPPGESLSMIAFAGCAYLFGVTAGRGAARDAAAAIETQTKAMAYKPLMRPLRLHVMSMLALTVLAWTLAFTVDWPVNHPLDAGAMTIFVVVGGMLTARRAAAAYWAHHFGLADGDHSLAARVEAARQGAGSAVLFRLQARDVMDEFVRFTDVDAETPPIVRVPDGVFPELAVGEWVLADEPVIVGSIGGGEGYRAGEAYERLDQCRRFDVLKTLPSPPKGPTHPLLIEVGLVGLVALLTGVGLTLGKHMAHAGL